MEPSLVHRPKKLLIAMWIVSVISLLILTPVTFIAAIFSSDNSSGATSAMSYAFLLAPLVLLALPIVAQIMYRRGAYAAAKKLAIVAIAVYFAALGYLVSLFLG